VDETMYSEEVGRNAEEQKSCRVTGPGAGKNERLILFLVLERTAHESECIYNTPQHCGGHGTVAKIKTNRPLYIETSSRRANNQRPTIIFLSTNLYLIIHGGHLTISIRRHI
jgi:hypothetical protein